jgi:alkylresorcinol/alkylpyrone synthase
MRRFLEDHGRDMGDVGMHLIHPGGRRILEAYTHMHALDADATRFSRESLRRYGNLSSASVLSVLELALRDVPSLPDGKEAFVMAIGPGLSLEMLLLDWNGRRA